MYLSVDVCSRAYTRLPLKGQLTTLLVGVYRERREQRLNIYRYLRQEREVR